MTHYKEQNVTGSAYIRAREVAIDNPLDGPKYVRFVEERVVNLGGDDRVTSRVPGIVGLVETFTQENAATAFPLMDQNGDPTGGMATYSEVYLALSSLYYHLARQRDQQAAE